MEMRLTYACGMIVTGEGSRSKQSTSSSTIFVFTRAKSLSRARLQTAEKRLHARKISRFTSAHIQAKSRLYVNFLGAIAVSPIPVTARSIRMFTRPISLTFAEWQTVEKATLTPAL